MAVIAIATQAVLVVGSSVRLCSPGASIEACCCIGVAGSSRRSGWDTLGLGSSSSLAGRGRRGEAGGVQVELTPTRLAAQGGLLKFGNNGMDSEGAGIYGSQKREDFDRDDVEQYFNFMGILATEGSFDKIEALLNTRMQAVDMLLLLAALEGDIPKVEELLGAGADYRVKDDTGRNALDRAQDEDIREFIRSKSQLICRSKQA